MGKIGDTGVTTEEIDAAMQELIREDEAKEKLARKLAKAKVSATGTANVTIPNDPKINVSFGIDKLKDINKDANKNKEGNMANELEVTEVDIIKNEKIEKQKKFQENVNNAIAIAADLKDDVKKIKEEICEGSNCLKNQVTTKFGTIEDRLKAIEDLSTAFVCEKCGYNGVKALTSFCPNCGAKIPSWADENGQPIADWIPYWLRNR